MNADRFAEVERLYHEAMIRPAEERAAFLDQACGGDGALRREVQSLLAIEADADTFLSRSALEEAVRVGHGSWEADPWPTIPGYSVRRLLGEGGMGVVYLADQETPFRRQVALKLIKPGMDTRQVVARFETERQALALMDHPNIAAVFDAGATKDGRPYFVMEYVDGLPITEYCDRERLSTRDRLALFVQVCAAVQHAHQKGVIHRDLKPSNVLVAERDGHALPKVIDFGTAKAVGGSWNATATEGGQGMVLGTLEYMSPEQAALSADIDTATDVYSLGVLLYELLVGRLPFDTAELRAAGYDEIRRVIRESDPPKPSVRVEQRKDQSGTVARARQTDAPGLTRQLRGDLDWITLKALEKDRARRYSTAAAFATDVERFLADQPVEARPPSSTYRIRKFTRRHRLAVAAGATIITILATGVIATTGLYWQATQQREEAVAQRGAAERATAEANQERARAVEAQADSEAQRSRTMSALEESTYFAYVATLAAAAGDLRTNAVAEARARLLTIPEGRRGWEWQHLFIQTDESVLSFSSAAPPCLPATMTPSHLFTRILLTTTALSLDADGESILLRRCDSLERWNVAAGTHTAWTPPPQTFRIMAANSRGQVLTTHIPQAEPNRYQLTLTARSGSAAPVSLGPFDLPLCADISADGARIGFGLAPNPAVPGDVFEVWDVATNRLDFRLVAAPPARPDTRAPTSCEILFSPDGRSVATSGARVHVWDAATGAERASDQLQAATYRQAIAFNRSGTLLAIGRPSGLVDLMDLTHPSPSLVRLSADDRVEESTGDTDVGRQNVFLKSKREVFAVTFSPDDQTVVSGTSSTVGIWDIRQSKRVRVLTGHVADVTDVAVSADGHRIYSVDTTGVVRIWPSTSSPAVLRIPGSSVNRLPFVMSATGSVIATATIDDAITAVRLADLHQEVIRPAKSNGMPQESGYRYTLSSFQGPSFIAMSPDGLRVFAAEPGGSIRRWTIGTNESVSVSIPDRPGLHDPKRRLLRVSPSGALLAFTQLSGDAVTLYVWDTSRMKQLAELEPENTLPERLNVLFRDERTLLVTGNFYQKSTIQVWDWRTKAIAAVDLRPALGLPRAPWRLVMSPDRRRIALLSSDLWERAPVSIWDADLKTEVGRLPPGDYLAVAFSPDGRRIVSVGFAETVVRIWDSERFLPLLTLPDTDTHMGGVAFTASGQIVAGRTDGGLTIWDTQIRKR